MARLFITQRELAFISDITKEIVHDVNDQAIILYSVSSAKTMAHDVYNEAIKKVFENPIRIACLVDAVFHQDTEITQFGVDSKYKIDVFIQYRDLIDRGIEINIGDFFSYDTIFFEVTNIKALKNIYGQAEHKNGIIVNGTKARQDQFRALVHGPTDIKYTDADAVQKTFVQSRGESENSNGLTGDKRDLQEIVGKPLGGPNEISERGNLDGSTHLSSFYGDDPEGE